MDHLIYLALGSNLGNRLDYLQNAIDQFNSSIKPLRLSPVYESEAWGFTDQGDFLNMVIEAETNLSPKELLDHVKQIEKSVGRQESFKNGPREIDIDILLFDNLVMQEDNLIIPHPDISSRSFVLKPLADLIPDQRHPSSSLPISEMLIQLGNKGSKLSLYDDKDTTKLSV